MSDILSEITQIYPPLELELLVLPADEASDLRFLSELASHVIELFEAGRIKEMQPAFDLAERLIAAGSDAERQAAILGFLETIQNVASHRKFGASAFESFLGPVSRRAWTELNDQWKGKVSLAEVVASETGARLDRPWWQFWKRRDRRTPSGLLDQVENAELRKIIEQITRRS